MNKQLSIRLAIDIGSTLIKCAKVGPLDNIVEQFFYPRDFELGIAKQVASILGGFSETTEISKVHICSSANGGLRIGIISLTQQYSGAFLRNQALIAGANPVFVHILGVDEPRAVYVDALLIGGGIDCPEPGPLAVKLQLFDPYKYNFGSLIYAGNKYLAEDFVARFPKATVIENPLSVSLRGESLTVFAALRNAYLNDLVHKEGISELPPDLVGGIRPTPAIVNQGFQRAVYNQSDLKIIGACILMDVGGATTDIHYTVELVRKDSINRPSAGSSIARYVFTDLGTVASRDSTLLQMRIHPRMYEFLSAVFPREEASNVYRSLREGEYDPPETVLAYACLFLTLERFSQGKGPGLPSADIDKLSQFILTGGCAQVLNAARIQNLLKLFLSPGENDPSIIIDRDYSIWVAGITWRDVPVYAD